MKSINDLNQEKAKLMALRGEKLSDLACIKARLVKTLPLPQFAALEGRRREVVAELQQIETQASAIKSEIFQLTQQTAPSPSKPQFNGDILRAVIDLRDEYQEFAADGTRSPTMRKMATELVVKLNPIIRKSLKVAA